MIRQSQTQAKHTPIATVRTMNDAHPILFYRHKAEIDDPQVCQASCNHQETQAFRLRQVAFIEVKPTTFLVRKEGFDLEALFIPIASFIGQVKVGDQEGGFKITPLPPGNDGHRSVTLAGEPDIRDTDLIPLAQEQVAKRKWQIVFVKLGILGSTTDVTQTQRLQSRLEFDAVKFAISEKDRLTIVR